MIAIRHPVLRRQVTASRRAKAQAAVGDLLWGLAIQRDFRKKISAESARKPSKVDYPLPPVNRQDCDHEQPGPRQRKASRHAAEQEPLAFLPPLPVQEAWPWIRIFC